MDCFSVWERIGMFKINGSPMFWLVLGILWSVTVLLLVLERGFVFNFAYIFIGLLAVLCYITAIFLTFKHR
jgi:uncharacterized membrane protein